MWIYFYCSHSDALAMDCAAVQNGEDFFYEFALKSSHVNDIHSKKIERLKMVLS